MKTKSWIAKAGRYFGCKATYHWGDGQIAFVTPCRELHFSLWPTKEEAEKRKAKVDRTGCCGGCWPETHYIVDLEEAK